MAIEALSDRPPYVQWEMREIEDRNGSIAAGHWVGKDVAYAVVTRPGSKDDLHMVAREWLDKLTKEGKSGVVPAMWATHFRTQFEQWEKGETGVVDGTPIKGWGLLGPAAQKTLISAGVSSVEDLATMPDQELASLGTGAVSYKQKAKAFLEAANGPGKMAEKFTSLEVKIAELVTLTAKLTEENQALRAKLPADPKKG